MYKGIFSFMLYICWSVSPLIIVRTYRERRHWRFFVIIY